MQTVQTVNGNLGLTHSAQQYVDDSSLLIPMAPTIDFEKEPVKTLPMYKTGILGLYTQDRDSIQVWPEGYITITRKGFGDIQLFGSDITIIGDITYANAFGDTVILRVGEDEYRTYQYMCDDQGLEYYKHIEG